MAIKNYKNTTPFQLRSQSPLNDLKTLKTAEPIKTFKIDPVVMPDLKYSINSPEYKSDNNALKGEAYKTGLDLSSDKDTANKEFIGEDPNNTGEDKKHVFREDLKNRADTANTEHKQVRLQQKYDTKTAADAEKAQKLRDNPQGGKTKFGQFFGKIFGGKGGGKGGFGG